MSAKRLAAGDSVIFIWYATFFCDIIPIHKLTGICCSSDFVDCYSGKMCSTSNSERVILYPVMYQLVLLGLEVVGSLFYNNLIFLVLVSFLSPTLPYPVHALDNQ